MTETTPPAGPPAPTPVQVIDGYNGRKVNNALTITFVQDGTGQPFAQAQQGKGDGAGKKLGILFAL